MMPIIELMNECLPQNKPRYLMGVGTPADIVRAIGKGVDMFDCVLPTRNARNGSVFTKHGTMSVKSAAYSCDYRPIDEECGCICCHSYSRAYLRHLLNVNEIAGRFGGGGHPQAAGAELPGSVADVQREVLHAARAALGAKSASEKPS